MDEYTHYYDGTAKQLWWRLSDDGKMIHWFYAPEMPEEPEIQLSEGQTGVLKNSRMPFRITKIEGDDITIRYLHSRQDWTGKKADLIASADFDALQ